MEIESKSRLVPLYSARIESYELESNISGMAATVFLHLKRLRAATYYEWRRGKGGAADLFACSPGLRIAVHWPESNSPSQCGLTVPCLRIFRIPLTSLIILLILGQS